MELNVEGGKPIRLRGQVTTVKLCVIDDPVAGAYILNIKYFQAIGDVAASRTHPV
jgi:hypothetical protein